MFTNDEIRRLRLAQLADSVGGMHRVAKKAEVSAQNLDHIVKRRRQSMRADGSKPLVALGDATARKIEAAHGLSPGWLDWPFPEVDFEAFAKLSAMQRANFAGQVMAALRSASQLQVSDALRQAERVPAPDKAVTKAFKKVPG